MLLDKPSRTKIKIIAITLHPFTTLKEYVTQVNAISNYDSGTGKAVLYLDPGSNSSNGYNKAGSSGDPGHDDNDIIQDLFLQTAGNRSTLGNDFTQINDLAYGLVTNNGAFSSK